jgi:hypothetical protein
MEKKVFKYYAIRVLNTIVFRRTISELKRVRSVLYRPRTEFRLEQVTYTGGRVIGSMSAALWQKHGGKLMQHSQCIRVTREQFRAMEPYMQKGE